MSFENKTFHDYKFIKFLGKGTYGELYLTQKGSGQTFRATKIFDRKQYDSSNWLKLCLDKEIEIMKELDHPNIVKFYGNEESETNYYLFMEYCNGGNLTEILKVYKKEHNDSFSWEIIQYFMRQIVKGVEYIHSKGIIHRDIKTDNILLTFKNPDDLKNLNLLAGQIKIIDFGVATKLDSFGEASTAVGSPIYMDPLILKQHIEKKSVGKYDQRVDIWSLGAVFYQLLTGDRLYHVKSVAELEKKVEEGNYFIPKSKIQFKEPISFLNAMLQYSHEDRYTIKELAAENFIVKDIKDFTKTDLTQISYKIKESGLEINYKENDTIYNIFNSGNAGFNKEGSKQAIRRNSNNAVERERGFSYHSNIYDFNKEENDKLMAGLNFQRNPYHRKTDGNIADNKNVNDFKNKFLNNNNKNENMTVNINDNDKELIKKYVNGLLSEYKAVKQYFNVNGFKKLEEDSSKKLVYIQQYLQDFQKGNYMNIKNLPQPVTMEYLYGSINKRENIFREILTQYYKESKDLENQIRAEIIKYQQLDKEAFSVLKEEVMPKINSDKQKLDELKKFIQVLEQNRSNKWTPPPEIEEDFITGEFEEISYQGCEFKMIIKTTKTNYNSACKLILRFNMKINENKNFYGDVKIGKYDFEEEIKWNLKDKDWENLSDYFIKVDFIYDNKYMGNTKLDISELKENCEINSNYTTNFPNNNGSTTFNFNIKIIMPEGKKKVIKGMEKVIKVIKFFPPFEGKSPDTLNIPIQFRKH